MIKQRIFEQFEFLRQIWKFKYLNPTLNFISHQLHCMQYTVVKIGIFFLKNIWSLASQFSKNQIQMHRKCQNSSFYFSQPKYDLLNHISLRKKKMPDNFWTKFKKSNYSATVASLSWVSLSSVSCKLPWFNWALSQLIFSEVEDCWTTLLRGTQICLKIL